MFWGLVSGAIAASASGSVLPRMNLGRGINLAAGLLGGGLGGFLSAMLGGDALPGWEVSALGGATGGWAALALVALIARPPAE